VSLKVLTFLVFCIAYPFLSFACTFSGFFFLFLRFFVGKKKRANATDDDDDSDDDDFDIAATNPVDSSKIGSNVEIVLPTWGPFSNAFVWHDSKYQQRLAIQVHFPSGVTRQDISVVVNDFRILVISMTLPKFLFDAAAFGDKDKGPVSQADEAIYLHALGDAQRKWATRKVQVQFELPFEVSDQNICITFNKDNSAGKQFTARTITVHLTPLQRGHVAIYSNSTDDSE
jgi:hypothetical protein